MVLRCKKYFEKRLLRILLHILSSSLELPRGGCLADDPRGRQSAVVLLPVCFFSLGVMGEEIGKPRSKFGKFFFISLTVVTEITLRVLRKL